VPRNRPGAAQAGFAAAPAPETAAVRTLCVDLDGTLVRTDTLLEAFLCLMKHGLAWLLAPLWLLKGRAYLKRRIAAASPLDVATLPYNEELVAELRRQRDAGRPVYLATGADETIAGRVAEHLGLFDGIVASDGRVNRVGDRKRQTLEARFGRGGFDYIGNGAADLPLWAAAGQALAVNPSARLRRAAAKLGIPLIEVCSAGAGASLGLVARAVRVQQWVKNLLLFVPLVLSHRLSPELLAREALAFVLFSLTASCVYLINDLLDLAADRKHPRKRRRPFAAGRLPLWLPALVVPLFLAASALGALAFPPAFRLILALYFGASLLYSLWLKRMLPLDVLVLAGLYTVRILAGGAASGVTISPWTLAFSIFVFLSLAMVKRVSELRHFEGDAEACLPGRDYMRSDIQQLSSLGGAAGYTSVVVMALYINSPAVQKLYTAPHWLWLALPLLLYWFSRIWLLTGRGRVSEDPVLFALKDRPTYVVLAALLLAGALAT
jgi:4-hydroxybenzoate polyprenyltransferase/phosphoserine phosphatase